MLTKPRPSATRIRSAALVVGMLLFGVVGNWHSHAPLPSHGDRPALDGLAISPSEVWSCAACVLSHHSLDEVRVATRVVVEVSVDRTVPPVRPTHETDPPDPYSSRAPPRVL